VSMPVDLKEGFSDCDFIVRPQRVEDNTVDYEAVMASRFELREWSDSCWPEDDFSFEDNLKDLLGHIQEHSAGTDLGFSIMERNERKFLGSLYINDPAELDEDYPDSAETNRKARIEFRVEYWMRRGVLVETEKAFVLATQQWLSERGYTRAVWGSRKTMVSRRELYESLGMRHLASLNNVASTRTFSLHWWPY